jgi:site-specific recombinase XerD
MSHHLAVLGTRPRRSEGPWAAPKEGLQPNLDLDLNAWFECYLADCEARGLSPRTLAWYRDRGRRVIGHLETIGACRPADLNRRTVSVLMSWVRSLEHRGRPLDSQTVLGYWQVGKAVVTFLRAEGAFDGPNPFDLFGKPRVREKAMWAPSGAECLAMLRVPDRRSVRSLRDLVMLYILMDTGMRVSALANIKIRDIDLIERRIRVLEKGEKERILPFGVQVQRWLRRYLAAAGLSLEDFLFPGYTGRPISRKRIDEVIKKCAARAGVREGKVSAHDLRRAFAREFLRNGGDMESLRQMLGHSSYAMVKRYAELASDVVASQHRRASPGDHLAV